MVKFFTVCLIERIDQIRGGYDHNFVLNDLSENLKLAAELYDPMSGRKLEIYSTEPGLQFYAGYNFNGSQSSPEGIVYERYAGLALEPQHFPDSPNQSQFPSTILRPG